MASCDCGCDVVEDCDGESFCVSCGSKVSEDKLVTHTNKYDKFTGSLCHSDFDAGRQYIKTGIFFNSSERYKLRQKYERKRRIREIVYKIHLPHPDLIAETACSLLDGAHLMEPRKHLLKKHIAAGIYASCKLHNLDVSLENVLEPLNTTIKQRPLRRIIHQLLPKQEYIAPSSDSVPLVEFRDLERNEVIPSTEQYYSMYCKLQEILTSTRLSSKFTLYPRIMLGVLVNMVTQHLEGRDIEHSKLTHFNIHTEMDLARFNQGLTECWNMLGSICQKCLPWLMPLKMGQQRVVGVIKSKLQIVLDNKACILQHLQESNKNARKRCPPSKARNEKPTEKRKEEIPPEEEEKEEEDEMYKATLALFQQKIDTPFSPDIHTYFNRMLDLLKSTELKARIASSPAPFYLTLLHQIISHMHELPELSKFCARRTTTRIDQLIRLQFIRVFLTYRPCLIPTQLNKTKLVSDIHTYYYTLYNNDKAFKCILRELQEEFSFFNNLNQSPSPSSLSSPRSVTSDSSSSSLLAELLRCDENSREEYTLSCQPSSAAHSLLTHSTSAHSSFMHSASFSVTHSASPHFSVTYSSLPAPTHSAQMDSETTHSPHSPLVHSLSDHSLPTQLLSDHSLPTQLPSDVMSVFSKALGNSRLIVNTSGTSANSDT